MFYHQYLSRRITCIYLTLNSVPDWEGIGNVIGSVFGPVNSTLLPQIDTLIRTIVG